MVVGVLVANFICIESFYLPGLAPVNYCKKEDEQKTCKVSVVLPFIKY